MARLRQTYIVDQVSRAIYYRLEWVKRNQNAIFDTSRNSKPVDGENGCEDDTDNK